MTTDTIYGSDSRAATETVTGALQEPSGGSEGDKIVQYNSTLDQYIEWTYTNGEWVGVELIG